MKNKDLNFMYRKTINKNIYIFSKILDEIMDYEEYKEVIYQNKSTNYKYYKYIENLKKCLSFLINTKIEKFETITLNILYNLLFNKNLNDELKRKIKELEKEEDYINLLIKLLKLIEEQNQYDRYAYAYIIINYVLMIKKKQLYRYNIKFLKKVYQIINNNQDYELLKKEIDLIIENGLTLDKNYYQNLEELNSKDVEKILIKNKEKIKKEFNIEHLYMFGSFAKEKQRIDSDIDLLAVFKKNMTYEEKKKSSQKLKDFILKELKRYGDIMEFNLNSIQKELYYEIY